MIAPALLLAFLMQGLTGQARAQQPDTLFEHARHQSLACTECHSKPTTHGASKITSSFSCRGCHHGPAQRAACATCHATGPASLHIVPVRFRVSVQRDEQTRPISFAHARHGAVACATCHATDVDRAVAPAACNDCHADHHAPARDCASCHPTARAGHDRGVHEGCAGCHTDARVASLTSSKSLCLACHKEQRAKHHDGDCSACHAVELHPGAKAGSPK